MLESDSFKTGEALLKLVQYNLLIFFGIQTIFLEKSFHIAFIQSISILKGP